MAKTKHNHLLDTIDEIITDGKKKGILHLYTEDEEFTGRKIRVKGKDLFHFGTTSYLGLDQEPRIREAAIDAIRKFGIQFPLSKTYLACGINQDLEECLFQMYGHPVLVSKNSTLTHISVIPSIIRDEDAAILDHQVHWTVQSACQLVKSRGVPVEIIRHSNLDMLESKIKELRDKHQKIWYLIDGIYSMFGDCAPIKELSQLLIKYPQLHLYIDDVHGMSWAGKHGNGWVMSQLGELSERIVLVTTLSKTFGASGGVAVFPDHELHRKVKTFGGPQTFSAQMEPPMVAAAIASAKIHLSDDIYKMQDELSQRISYCNSLIKQTSLPLAVESHCPIFFIGAGLPATGYNLVDRIINEGYYVNLGVFPAVPIKNTGLRFTISRHNTIEDIKGLVDTIAYHHPLALAEENRTQNQVRKAFNLPLLEEKEQPVVKQTSVKLTHETSIQAVNRKEWDTLVGHKGAYDWTALKFLEATFSENPKPEENWDFHYYIIRDNAGKPIIATFFTATIWKEDMLATAERSKQIEQKRLKDPYYLTSKIMTMGSMVTEGEHIYLDKKHPQWQEALLLLLDTVTEEKDRINASTIILRDFEDADTEIKDFLINQGYFKIQMPDTSIIEDLSWENREEFLQRLSPNNRKHLKREVFKYEHCFDVEVKHKISAAEIDHFYQLYKNVARKNFDINLFDCPKKFIENISGNPDWEFVVLRIKPEFDDRVNRLPVSVILSYKNAATKDYYPMLIGLDYSYLENFKLYKQSLFQVVTRAKALNASKLYFSFAASSEKRKFGATVIPKIAYIQTNDNYIIEMIDYMAVKSEA